MNKKEKRIIEDMADEISKSIVGKVWKNRPPTEKELKESEISYYQDVRQKFFKYFLKIIDIKKLPCTSTAGEQFMITFDPSKLKKVGKNSPFKIKLKVFGSTCGDDWDIHEAEVIMRNLMWTFAEGYGKCDMKCKPYRMWIKAEEKRIKKRQLKEKNETNN